MENHHSKDDRLAEMERQLVQTDVPILLAVMAAVERRKQNATNDPSEVAYRLLLGE